MLDDSVALIRLIQSTVAIDDEAVTVDNYHDFELPLVHSWKLILLTLSKKLHSDHFAESDSLSLLKVVPQTL